MTRAEKTRWWLVLIFLPFALLYSICRTIWTDVLTDVPRELRQFWSARPWRKSPSPAQASGSRKTESDHG